MNHTECRCASKTASCSVQGGRRLSWGWGTGTGSGQDPGAWLETLQVPVGEEPHSAPWVWSQILL